ncbi:putative DNA polymerase type B, organellar and viral family protein [Monocercomonoides exilis]|uniref:putative DNA polymerase type B, organellar and viral family protein n=1 Tax=Monocercomonoides exilis TaxID=2049356 RepID=UPI003559ACAF|nr:putative DNA polymerase type B, organellar and viral family protein [Monocercomonoides exilis]|eukprot:MONOS_9171.1-p1 / transcript=MONOS_9171.1 / gene=MONOS_9171 / organism=Monocercomonoides_exilis_PA203 / gene_product=DNA polymerase type B, organellar and viral family protein / transcript_product=DNA polymerase type B, organellar and viral family protein / location=Mono_scaffold00369:51019-52392(-) / protein_length=457 / sequence_SO=supercontig / SO=protein_coding / is_pseudo=false
MNDFDIDIHDYCSISSLADAILTKQVYSKNKNLYKLGGIIREFMQQAVHGGRCMTAYNKKWHSTTPIVDYDAVSLYASAMHRLYMVEGTPSVIETDEQRSYEFLKNQSAYVVEIEITKVNKHYPFPLLVFEDDEGNNFNNDVIDKPVRTVVDNIYLEDLIEFQKIEFTVIKGYFWTGNRDCSIQKVIGDIFNKRAAYKKEKNPLEVIYKLIMNSLYGKTIQKPVDYEIKYINENDIGKYWSKNYNKIIESSKIADSRNKTHVVKTQKQIDTHFTFNLFGIHILSMSKRIMNEVMCLAHDLNCQIYYQDTDSMHIRVDDLTRLEEAFKIKYNRDLKGTQLGNFHSDFPLNALYASESYFLGKKMYIDKLVLPENKTSNMFRMKGIKQSAVEAKAKESDNSNDSLMKLYKCIYKGRTVEFDLTIGSPCFEFEKDFTVASLDTFKRRIKTSLEKGIPPKG